MNNLDPQLSADTLDFQGAVSVLQAHKAHTWHFKNRGQGCEVDTFFLARWASRAEEAAIWPVTSVPEAPTA